MNTQVRNNPHLSLALRVHSLKSFAYFTQLLYLQTEAKHLKKKNLAFPLLFFLFVSLLSLPASFSPWLRLAPCTYTWPGCSRHLLYGSSSPALTRGAQVCHNKFADTRTLKVSSSSGHMPLG